MALDLGAGGVIVPMVETEEMARRAVEYCRYPPLGKRGCGPVRASNFFRHYDEYMAQANEEILLVVQIETIGSVGELDAILGVEGVDGIFVGPSDLALSMKGMGEAERPTLAETMAQIFEKARKRGVPYGTLADAPEDCVRYARQGATLLTVGGDLGFIMEGSVICLKETRSRLP
jgi:2-keto-3-deoxy-L-rhamnonate aldolase RhmA